MQCQDRSRCRNCDEDEAKCKQCYEKGVYLFDSGYDNFIPGYVLNATQHCVQVRPASPQQAAPANAFRSTGVGSFVPRSNAASWRSLSSALCMASGTYRWATTVPALILPTPSPLALPCSARPRTGHAVGLVSLSFGSQD